jgi:hypothetical protein
MNIKLLASIRYYFAQTVFCSKIHFKAADRLERKKRVASNWVVGTSIGTLAILFFQFVCFQFNWCNLIMNIATMLGTMMTILGLAISLVNKSDITSEIMQHRKYGNKYLCLRDDYMSLITDIMSDTVPDKQMRLKRDELQKLYDTIGADAPETDPSGKDYEAAQKSLGLSDSTSEEFTWADNDIDKFLPQQLKLSSS